MEHLEDLVDYASDEEQQVVEKKYNEQQPATDISKNGFVGIHATGFKEFLLIPEIIRAIADAGFEHPSEGRLI